MPREQLTAVLQHVRRLVGDDERSDRDLLDRFLGDRDEAAFRSLVERHGPMVLGVCRRVLGNGHDAEDAFQASFLVLAAKAGSVQHDRALSSWLYQVAYHISIKARARIARRPEPQPAPPSPDPTDEVVWRDLRPVLDEELNRLPSVYRQPVVLCYLEGMTQEQVARQLGWTKGTVSGRLARARQMLQSRLTRRGIALSVAVGLAGLYTSTAPAAPLVDSVARIASLFASGSLALAGASPAILLAQEAMKTMFRVRLAVAAALLLVLGFGGLGAGRLFCQPPGNPPTAEKRAEPVEVGERDPLLEGVLHRLGNARLHHAHNVLGIAFSADGKTVVSVGSDHLARLWDTTTGKEIRTFGEQDQRRNPYSSARWISTVALSPDGKLLATGENLSTGSTFRVWEVDTGKKLHEGRNHRGGVPSLAFSPDSKLLVSGGVDGTVRVLDVALGRERRAITTDLGSLRTVAFWDDGRRVVARNGEGLLRSWEVESGRQVGEDKERVEGLAVTPDGSLFALADVQGNVRVWDPYKNREVQAVSAGEEAVRCLNFSPDGKYLTVGAADRTVRLWEVATGKEVRSIPEQPIGVQAVAASSGGQRMAWAVIQDNVLHLVDVASGKAVAPVLGHRGMVRPLCWSDDGKRLLSSAHDRTLRCWDATTGKPLSVRPGPQYMGHAVAFAADGCTAVCGSGKGLMQLLDVVSGKELRQLEGLEKTVLATAVTPDGRRAAGLDMDGSLIVWDAATGKETIRQQLSGADTGTFLRLAPDGQRLFVGSGNLPGRVLDVKAGTWLELDAETSFALSGAFSPDGKLLATGWTTGVARVWDTVTGKQVHELPEHPGYVLSVAFSPDGKTVAAGSWRSVRLWGAATGKPVGRFTDVEGDVFTVEFSPDGRALACGCGDSTLLLCDVKAILK